MSKKEACPKCQSEKFAKATDKSNRCYCSKCSHVWIPGHTGMTSESVLLKRSQAEVQELKIIISRLEAKLSKYETPEDTDIADAEELLG